MTDVPDHKHVQGSRWITALTAPIRRPWLTLLITLILSIASIAVAMRAKPSAGIQDLLGTSNPAAAALQHVFEDFPSADELLILATLEESPADHDAGVTTLTRFGEAVTNALTPTSTATPIFRSVAYAASADMMDFIKQEAVPAGAWYLSDSEIDALTQRLTPAAMREQLAQNESMLSAPGPAADALSRALIKDPLRLREFLGSRIAQARAGFQTWRGGPEFISPDGRSILIRVAGVQPPGDLDFCKLMVREATALLAPITPKGVRVKLSGSYAIAAASEKAMRSDLQSSVFWSIVIMQAVFLLAYRNLLSFPLAFIPIAVSLLIAFGVHTLFIPTLTPLTAVIGAMLAGCGIDYSVYFISYFEAARVKGLAARPAAEDAVANLAKPLIAACATSVVGFIAVAFSSIRALRDFAMLGALGLTFALAGALWILPAMLTLTAKAGRLTHAGPRIGVGRLVEFICARPLAFIGACLIAAVTAAASLFTGGVRFETDLAVMHPRPNPPLETQLRIGELFGSADTMLAYASAPTTDALIPIAHRIYTALEDPALQTRANISGILGLPLLIPDPSHREARAAALSAIDVTRVISDFDTAVDTSSFEPSAFAPYKEFLQTLLRPGDPPTPATLAKYPELAAMLLGKPGTGPACLTIISMSQSTQSADIRDTSVEAIRTALAGIPGVTLTGLGVVGYDVEHAVRHDLPIFISIAGAAVICILFFSLRSIKDSLLALIPVFFGGLALLGLMSATGEKFNPANTVALPLLIGMGVDYGIFLVSMAQQWRKEGAAEPLTTRFAASFHAITLTATTSFIGFGSLALTSTPAVQSLGRVIGAGVIACLAGAFLLLAPILSLSAPTARPPQDQ